jgi:hypothetical protein
MEKIQTLNLLKLIGTPFNNFKNELNIIDITELYQFSNKNRMPLLYLRSLSELDIPNKYQSEYVKLTNQWLSIEERIKEILKILEKKRIKYTTFKSIKPYIETTVDIDLLIFDEYEDAVRELQNAGYILLERGPLSSTFRDPEIKIDYDIYDEVGVSHIIYYDKEVVKEKLIEKTFTTGGYIKSLSPDTDLLAIIAHSVIKEQMYILSEYYSTLYYLKRMDETDIDSFLIMSEKLRLNTAVKAHLGITYNIHKMVHKVEPTPLRTIISRLGYDGFETNRVLENGFKMPHKFHPFTLLKALGEQFQEPKSRRSVAEQLKNMANPRFLADFIPRLLSHVIRETD